MSPVVAEMGLTVGVEPAHARMDTLGLRRKMNTRGTAWDSLPDRARPAAPVRELITGLMGGAAARGT